MPSEVEIRLITNNSQAVKGIKEVAVESQKLYTNNEKGQKRQIGLIADIEKELAKLQTAQKNAMSIEQIEKYNKKIAEAKQALEEYNKVGLEQEKTNKSMIQSIGEWATKVIGATVVLNKLKDAFLNTRQGTIIFSTALAGMNQVLSNAVNGVWDLNKGVTEAMVLARQMALLKIQEKRDSLEINRLMRSYNELYNDGVDQLKSTSDRLDLLTEAKKKFIAATRLEIEITEKELENVVQAWKLDPTNIDLESKAIELKNRIEQLYGEMAQGTRRLTRQISGLQNSLFEDALSAAKQFNKDLQSEIDDRNKEILDKQIEQNKKEFDAQTEYYIQYRDMFFNYIDEINDKKEEQWKFDLENGKINFNAIQSQGKRAWDKMIENEKLLADAEKQVTESRMNNYASAGQSVLDYIAIIDELAQREVDEAEHKRELLETQIEEAQSALETETELYKAGYASNVAAKQTEIDALKKQRDQALIDEEKARKKEHTLKVAQLLAEQAIALAKIIMSSEIAKAEARVMIANPITAIPGLALLASIRIGEAISIAAVTASVIAASLSKFDKGGWTGNGVQKDNTGERVAGIVHEKEFVVRKGPANKFRDVLEAINKDDRKAVFNSFNKLSPEMLGGTSVNNILVENTGPNKRLDEVNHNLKRMSAKEDTQIIGNVMIIRKGNRTRRVRL